MGEQGREDGVVMSSRITLLQSKGARQASLASAAVEWEYDLTLLPRQTLSSRPEFGLPLVFPCFPAPSSIRPDTGAAPFSGVIALTEEWHVEFVRALHVPFCSSGVAMIVASPGLRGLWTRFAFFRPGIL